MSEPVVVVGGWASPFVTRVCIALKLKGVEYEFLQEAVGRKSELLLRSNPVHKKMPVLLHGGRPVCESLVILQYVDEAFPGSSILPDDPYHRAVHRFWAEYADAKLHTALRTMRGMVGGDKADAAEQVSAALRQLEDALAECSGGKPYFGGDDVGFLDIVVGSYIGWFGAAEKIAGLRVGVLDEASTPRLAAWAARFCAHEAVRDLMPDADRLVEFGEVLRAALAANVSSRP
ncbi:probable glutathione S-transferase GSTU6 [Lolium rigidum]|uniref:probable glutathione S-transferase GSTU6 n=1 Tax=Lolium rigidum TaxID=89674 RepID=UPI001F5C9537|nr:probable glutathione S-transferase GSTU6 [Lolium rigidum]